MYFFLENFFQFLFICHVWNNRNSRYENTTEGIIKRRREKACEKKKVIMVGPGKEGEIRSQLFCFKAAHFASKNSN